MLFNNLLTQWLDLPDADLVESIEQNWSSLPKDEILVEKEGEKLRLVVCFTTIRDYKIIVGVVVGPRKGLYDFVIVLGGKKQYIVDRLHHFDKCSSGGLMSHSMIMHNIKGGTDLIDAISSQLQSVLDSTTYPSAGFYRKIKNLPLRGCGGETGFINAGLCSGVGRG